MSHSLIATPQRRNCERSEQWSRCGAAPDALASARIYRSAWRVSAGRYLHGEEGLRIYTGWRVV